MRARIARQIRDAMIQPAALEEAIAAAAAAVAAVGGDSLSSSRLQVGCEVSLRKIERVEIQKENEGPRLLYLYERYSLFSLSFDFSRVSNRI